MPVLAQRWLRAMAALFGLVFLAGVFWFSSQQMMREYGYGDRSQSIGIPMVWYWLPLVFGIGLAAVVNVWLLYRCLRSFEQD